MVAFVPFVRGCDSLSLGFPIPIMYTEDGHSEYKFSKVNYLCVFLNVLAAFYFAKVFYKKIKELLPDPAFRWGIVGVLYYHFACFWSFFTELELLPNFPGTEVIDSIIMFSILPVVYMAIMTVTLCGTEILSDILVRLIYISGALVFFFLFYALGESFILPLMKKIKARYSTKK